MHSVQVITMVIFLFVNQILGEKRTSMITYKEIRIY